MAKRSMLLIALLCAGGAAQAETLFTFDNLAPGSVSSIAQTVDGITVSISGPSAFDLSGTGFAPFGARSIVTFNNLNAAPYIANFSEAVDNVSLDAGDFGSDADTMLLEAFSGLDATGTSLGSVTSAVCCNGFNFASISVALNASGIRSIRFFTGPSDMFPGSLFFDNLRVNVAAAPVPEPATWAAMLAGFVLTGAAARRRSARASAQLA
jgi:hypothetical protein